MDFNWEKLPTQAANDTLVDNLRDDDCWLPPVVVKFLPKELQREYAATMEDMEIVEIQTAKKSAGKRSLPENTPSYMKVGGLFFCFCLIDKWAKTLPIFQIYI